MTVIIIAVVLTAFGLLVRFALRLSKEIDEQKRNNDELQNAKQSYEREREAKDTIDSTSFDDVLDLNDRLRRDRKD